MEALEGLHARGDRKEHVRAHPVDPATPHPKFERAPPWRKGMSTVRPRRVDAALPVFPPALDRRFEAVVFDWDGTAVSDRGADAGELRRLVEQLCERGFDLVAVTETDVGNVDGQLGARPGGAGRLFFCVNRGSEVYAAGKDGLELLYRREATPAEEEALDAAARATVEELGSRGVTAAVVSQRLNRRKIDLIPEPEWEDPPRARLSELLDAVQNRLRAAGVAGLGEAVDIALRAAEAAGLDDPRVTSDAKHVEIGLTDKADSARWAFAELARRGVGPGLTLIAGDEFGPLGGVAGSDSFLLVPESSLATAISVGAEPSGAPSEVLTFDGGPHTFTAVLRDQLERRRRRDVPELEMRTGWTIAVERLDPARERVHESLLTIADGRLGTRGTPLFDDLSTAPAVLLSGAYRGQGAATALAAAPPWTRIFSSPPPRKPITRALDLATGLLREAGSYDSLRFSSLARPATVALRLRADGAWTKRRRPRRSDGVAALFSDGRRGRIFERVGAYAVDEDVARALVAEADEAGFEVLLKEHRMAWAARWQTADVVVEGDPELQLAIRFALFHLMASVADRGEAAVGARGLTGPAYSGHVFWDGDVFVLPFLAATHPGAARAMLEYRVRRLPAAREAARALGREGARFSWESAEDGRDVTPPSVRGPNGELIRIRTGELEEHIVGDVAWAAACYLDWTGDQAFANGPGRELFVETARYWASRVRQGSEGRMHLYGVIGPDEYHEPVDDNAYTNVLARWNLRRAAALPGVDAAECSHWLAIADALVDGYDRGSGIYEQFAGFHLLEPLVIEEVAPRRPIAADVLLGADRTAGAQVLKQADVLMLHHLLPDEVAAGSLVPNLDFYEPRTAHGSSLSPAIHASLLARAGRYRPALAALRIAARLDLDDLTGSTAGGLHLATMGGLWQALAFGFAGVRPQGDHLVVDPRLPREWGALEVALRLRGRPLRLRIDRSGVSSLAEGWEVARADNHWEVRPQ
jgi:trehalose/maltose hydrolase-like predicted phosphorylase